MKCHVVSLCGCGIFNGLPRQGISASSLWTSSSFFITKLLIARCGYFTFWLSVYGTKHCVLKCSAASWIIFYNILLSSSQFRVIVVLCMSDPVINGVEFVNVRLPCTVLRGIALILLLWMWVQRLRIKVMITEDSFYDKLESVFIQFHKYHMNILFEDFIETVSKHLP